MSFFLAFLFFGFILALIVLGTVISHIYRAWRAMRRVFGFSGSKSRYGHQSGRHEYERRRPIRYHRIIPKEYGVDVEYEVLTLTGKEQFLNLFEVRTYKGESQISDVKYVIITD